MGAGSVALRDKLVAFRRELIAKLETDFEDGMLALLSRVQIAIAAIDADATPDAKERWRE